MQKNIDNKEMAIIALIYLNSPNFQTIDSMYCPYITGNTHGQHQSKKNR